MTSDEQRAAEIAKYEEAYRSPDYGMGDARMDYVRGMMATLRADGMRDVLDVGCGRGEALLLARDAGLEAQGCEVVRYLAMAEDVDLIDGAHALHYPDRSYDVVAAFDVMEHILEDDVVPVLRELLRVARKRVVLTIALFRDRDYHVTIKPEAWWANTIKLLAPDLDLVQYQPGWRQGVVTVTIDVPPAFEDIAQPGPWIVAGCGPSTRDHGRELPDVPTIAVNDAGRWLRRTDVLFMGDEVGRYTPERLEQMRATAQIAPVFHTMGVRAKRGAALHPRDAYRVRTTGPLALDEPGRLPHHRTGTYVAIGLAYRLGATKIAVLGHDLRGHREFDRPEHIGPINEAAGQLVTALATRGVQIRNVSATSLVTAIPALPLSDLEAWLS